MQATVRNTMLHGCYSHNYKVISFPLLFSVYMDGVVREANVRVLGKWMELMVAGLR